MTTTDNGTSWTFDVTVAAPQNDSYVYAAKYDADGVMIGIKRVSLSTSGSTRLTLDKSGGITDVKLFVRTDKAQLPITKVYDMKPQS